MTQITLTSEQAAILDRARTPVRACMPDGSIAGWLTHEMKPAQPSFTAEETAEAQRRVDSCGPGRTTKEVFDRLRALEQS